MRCNICSSTRLKNVYVIKDRKHQTTKKTFQVKECLNCGILVVTENEMPVDGSLYYPDQYSAFQSINNKKQNKIGIYPLNTVKGRMAWTKLVGLTSNTKILDLGCGNGSNMKFIRDRFRSNIIGIEPSEKAVKEARKQELLIHHGTLDNFNPDQKFDIIYLLHVIEHISNPYKSLEKINEILRPDGVIVIGTPNTYSFEKHLFREFWDGWDTPRHIYMFNPKNIKYILENIGFKDIRIYYEMYSLFGRSINNISKSKYNYTQNKLASKFIDYINLILTYILPFIHYSGAIQIIAKKKVTLNENTNYRYHFAYIQTR